MCDRVVGRVSCRTASFMCSASSRTSSPSTRSEERRVGKESVRVDLGGRRIIKKKKKKKQNPNPNQTQQQHNYKKNTQTKQSSTLNITHNSHTTKNTNTTSHHT